MTTYLRVTMPDQSRWDVPVSVIAENRARFYAERDRKATSGEPFDEVYKLEYELTINNHDKLQDWAADNMNWEDVAHVAVHVMEDRPNADYQEGWVNGKKEMVSY